MSARVGGIPDVASNPEESQYNGVQNRVAPTEIEPHLRHQYLPAEIWALETFRANLSVLMRGFVCPEEFLREGTGLLRFLYFIFDPKKFLYFSFFLFYPVLWLKLAFFLQF